ncbi:hypothetical protein, partial [Bifidobacterium longum]|uniref:hypothetical protein n=1 Tax=Bifidobacterium longum TaxID=216816 RepID=UPI003D079A13
IMFYIVFSLIPSPFFILLFGLSLIFGWISGGKYMDAVEERQRQEDEYYRNLEKRLQELEEKSNEKNK